MEAQTYLTAIEGEAEAIMQMIADDYNPDDDDEASVNELSQYFEDGSFDEIAWLNDNALEADQHDILLCTGGPAYGVCKVHGTPMFWHQDWFEGKTVLRMSSDAIEFYGSIFDMLEELDS